MKNTVKKLLEDCNRFDCQTPLFENWCSAKTSIFGLTHAPAPPLGRNWKWHHDITWHCEVTAPGVLERELWCHCPGHWLGQVVTALLIVLSSILKGRAVYIPTRLSGDWEIVVAEFMAKLDAYWTHNALISHTAAVCLYTKPSLLYLEMYLNNGINFAYKSIIVTK